MITFYVQVPGQVRLGFVANRKIRSAGRSETKPRPPRPYPFAPVVFVWHWNPLQEVEGPAFGRIKCFSPGSEEKLSLEILFFFFSGDLGKGRYGVVFFRGHSLKRLKKTVPSKRHTHTHMQTT